MLRDVLGFSDCFRKSFEKSTPIRHWLFVLMVAIGMSSTAEAGLLMLVQLYLKELQTSALVISLNTTFASLGLVVGSWYWGGVSDKRSRKPVILLLLGMSALLIGCLALRLPAPGVLADVGLYYFAVGGLTPIALGIVSSRSLTSRRGKELSYVSASRSLGWVVGVIVAGILLRCLGFRWSFGILAALPLAVIPLLIRLPEQWRKPVAAERSSSRHLAAKRLWWLYLGVILRQMGVSGAMSLVYVYMAVQGVSASSMGAVSALNPAVHVVALPLFGRLGDYIGRKPVFLLGFTLSAGMALIFSAARDISSMATGFLVLGLSYASLYSGSTAYIGDRVSMEKHGRMLGLFEASMGLGGVLGPIISGSVTPLLGFQKMFLVMASITVTSFLLVFFKSQVLVSFRSR